MSSLSAYPLEGKMSLFWSDANWGTITASENAEGISTSAGNTVGLFCSYDSGIPLYDLRRHYWTFSTTAVPRGAVITGATASFWAWFWSGSGWGQYLQVGTFVTTGLTSNIQLTDWGKFSDLASDSEVNFASPQGYKHFPLNAAGLAAINPTGNTYFVIRYEHDYNNAAPTGLDYVYVRGPSYGPLGQNPNLNQAPTLRIEYIEPPTTTIYPAYGDGYIYKSGTDWDAVKAAQTGDGVDYTTSANSNVIMRKLGNTITISRLFLPFTTTSVPEGSIILGATANVYPWYNSGYSISTRLAIGDQSDTGVLAVTDFGKVYDLACDAETILTSNAYRPFVLNQAGLNAIASSSWAKFVIIHEYDYKNTAPTAEVNYAYIRQSEYTTQNQRPYLIVQYLTGTVTGQVGIPIAGVSTGSWLSTTNSLFNAINEVLPVSSDYCYLQYPPTTGSTFEVSISGLTDPQTNTGHVVWYGFYRQNSASAVNLTAALVQGSTIIASAWHENITSNTGTISSFTLTTTEADAITNYADLRLRFTASVT